jgi:hypothetical protein
MTHATKRRAGASRPRLKSDFPDKPPCHGVKHAPAASSKTAPPDKGRMKVRWFHVKGRWGIARRGHGLVVRVTLIRSFGHLSSYAAHAFVRGAWEPRPWLMNNWPIGTAGQDFAWHLIVRRISAKEARRLVRNARARARRGQ